MSDRLLRHESTDRAEEISGDGVRGIVRDHAGGRNVFEESSGRRSATSSASLSISDSPPYLHDGRLLTLGDTIEFFNPMLETHLTAGEKSDLEAFLRVL